jgi:hypothetical protein
MAGKTLAAKASAFLERAVSAASGAGAGVRIAESLSALSQPRLRTH